MSKIKINGKDLNTKELEQMLSNLRPAQQKPICVLAMKIDQPFEVKTLEGVMKGNAGDYLVVGIKGEPYPVKPDIFEMTYDWL